MSLNEYQQFEESINARIRLLESEKLDLVARFKKAASKRDMVNHYNRPFILLAFTYYGSCRCNAG